MKTLLKILGGAAAVVVTEAVTDNKTKVTWGMTGANLYPFNLMHLFTDRLLGKDLETSLTTLKSILEKK